MRMPKLVVALVAGVVLLAGCGDDDTTDQAGSDSSVTTEATTDTDGAGDLDADVAAVVNGEEISAASIDEHVDAFAENPQFADQLEGPEGEAALVQLRAQVLSTTIVANIVTASAEELGDPVTDDDIAEARTELEDQVGGAEALETALAQQGLTESLLNLELTSLAAMRNLEAVLDEEAGADSEPEVPGEAPGEQPQLSPSEQRVQDFLTEELARADVTVNEDFGSWNAETGQVAPPGAAPVPGAGGG